MKYRVIIGATALRDLTKIFEYISRDSEVNAARMIERILNGIDSLDSMPYRYNVPRVGKVRSRRYRSMPVWPYLVRYHVDEKANAVRILRIRHGARRRP